MARRTARMASLATLAAAGICRAQATSQPADYARAADGATRYIETTFALPGSALYAQSTRDRAPEFMWGNGIQMTALLGAARHDPRTYRPTLDRFFIAMDAYWDRLAPLGGYEPAPTVGNGHDKYYDDNAWIAIACVEAFELTNDRRYLDRAEATLRFVLSGWDDARGGGIWWHEGHKEGSKNTCANAPAAVACLRVAQHQSPERAAESIAMARRIVDWTVATLEDEDGLFADSIRVDTGRLNRDRLTYNTALMTRAFLGLWRATGEADYRRRAERSSAASRWFADGRTGVYRDSVKWSHLLVEADLEMYRATGDAELLRRATINADAQYAAWKAEPPAELIDNASIARTLWLLADAQPSTRPAP